MEYSRYSCRSMEVYRDTAKKTLSMLLGIQSS